MTEPTIYRCNKAMWWGYGAPAGTCNEPSVGEQTDEGYSRTQFIMSGPACPRHGGPDLPPHLTREVIDEILEAQRDVARLEREIVERSTALAGVRARIEMLWQVRGWNGG